MAKVFIADIKKDIDKFQSQKVELKGWVYSLRSSGKLKFLLLRDGTGLCQCTFVKSALDDKIWRKCSRLTQESTVQVSGLLNKDTRSPGGFEISVEHLNILHLTQNYPITPKEHGIDFLMNHRHLWLRSKKQHAILRIRGELISAIRDFFNSRDFTLVDPPILTINACEGTSTLFKTSYFDKPFYLSQSGQLYMEAAAAAFGKAYSFGPTFRAEKSKTRKHLIEFWMVEPEVAFNNLQDNMELAEEFVEHIIQRVLKHRQEELTTLERDVSLLEKVKAPFPRLHYKEAAKLIQSENPDFSDGADFGAPEETFIGNQFDRPVFVHNYPASIKAFYMKRDEDHPDESKSCDLIATEGYGEIIGGGQREDNKSQLLQRIKEHNLSFADFEWYIDLRDYGAFPSAGFGLGVERMLSWICGLSHVRETIPFPRLYGRSYP